MLSPRPSRPNARSQRRYTAIIGYVPATIIVLLLAGQTAWPDVAARQSAPSEVVASHAEAARLFFSGQYDASAEMSQRLRVRNPEDLAAIEQRSSALHFQLKRVLADSAHARDKRRALRECESCATLIDAIAAEISDGREFALARLDRDPDDLEASFFLGKLNLTHVWLHNDTLGRRTGWSEYREARRVLDKVLERDPDHVRAKVARAWIDYVVDTRVPWAFRWMLGGGNRKRALASVHEAAAMPAPPAIHAEAAFALWEMLARDGQIAEAVTVAGTIVKLFPDNREVRRFLETHDTASR